MKKWLMTLAMLVATQASAATVAPSETTPGAYLYSLGTVDYDTSLYGGWRLFLTVNGTALDGFYYGARSTPMENPNGKLFQFTPTGNPASVTVSAVLHRYINPGYSSLEADQTQNVMPYMRYSRINPTLNTTNVKLSIASVTYTAFSEPPKQDINALTQRITVPTAVPLGGTLPLMLTALGLGGWVVRARLRAV